MSDKKNAILVHWKGKPFHAIIKKKGSEPIELIPIVAETRNTCGCGVMFPDGSKWLNGPTYPRNLIAGWRGSVILSNLNEFEGRDLYGAYEAGQRHNLENPSMFSEPVIEKLGREKYEEIMAMLVPEEIIRAILDNQHLEDPPDLWPITGEVRAGTIGWRQEFADAGITHPDVIIAKERHCQEVLDSLEPLLQSFASFRWLSRRCNLMDFVDGAAITAVDIFGDEMPKEIVVALAGVIGDIMFLEPSSLTFSGIRATPESREKNKEESLRKSAGWLSKNYTQKEPWWWKYVPFLQWAPKPVYTTDDAKQLLRELLDQFLKEGKARKEAEARSGDSSEAQSQ